MSADHIHLELQCLRGQSIFLQHLEMIMLYLKPMGRAAARRETSRQLARAWSCLEMVGLKCFLEPTSVFVLNHNVTKYPTDSD